MKNKDFIKKSIEDNIVDSSMVLNNIKAKAAVLESSRAYSKRSGVGLRRAGVLAALLVLTAACVMSCIYFFNPDDGAAPPIIDNCSHTKSDIFSDGNIKITMSEKTGSKSGNNSNDTVSKQSGFESREPKSESECSDMIDQIPLEGNTKVFFESFSDNFAVFQNMFNARLQNSGALTEGYSEVKDSKFTSLKDIKDFLYSFMEPECAGEIYIGLTCGDKPYYIEKDGTLYELAGAPDNKITSISTDDAFLTSESDDTLIINAMLVTNGGQDYYQKFQFVKKNGEWIYSSEDWRTPAMFTNYSNNK